MKLGGLNQSPLWAPRVSDSLSNTSLLQSDSLRLGHTSTLSSLWWKSETRSGLFRGRRGAVCCCLHIVCRHTAADAVKTLRDLSGVCPHLLLQWVPLDQTSATKPTILIWLTHLNEALIIVQYRHVHVQKPSSKLSLWERTALTSPSDPL